MHRRLLLLTCTALTLLFASMPDKGRAQTAPSDWAVSPAKTPSPFDDVSAYAWPYVAVDTLQTAGIVIGYPGGTYTGRRTMTRYEFAVSIARMLPLISPRKGAASESTDLKALRLDVQTRLEHSPLAINALIALLNEFAPELKRLGQGVPPALERLEALKQTFIAAALAEIAQDDPAYSRADTLRRAGIVLDFPDETVPVMKTRYQFAVAVIRLFPLLIRPTIDQSKETSGLFDETQQRLAKHPQALVALTALINEFQPEIGLLLEPKVGEFVWHGVTLQAVKTQLTALGARPFSDVRPNHWAASSVAVMRLNGILVGYPDGAFETSGGHD